MNKEEAGLQAFNAANRLGKWRTLLAGWVLGTRLDDDQQARGMRDLQEARLLMRAELSALTRLVVDKKLVTEDELYERLTEEYDALNDMMAAQFPGISASDNGLHLKLPEAHETMKRLGFPP